MIFIHLVPTALVSFAHTHKMFSQQVIFFKKWAFDPIAFNQGSY
jgi:hypothetical protein